MFPATAAGFCSPTADDSSDSPASLVLPEEEVGPLPGGHLVIHRGVILVSSMTGAPLAFREWDWVMLNLLQRTAPSCTVNVLSRRPVAPLRGTL